MFVRQFRPAVFCKSLASDSLPWNPDSPPNNEFSTEAGKTWELCAGIIGETFCQDKFDVAHVHVEIREESDKDFITLQIISDGK